MPQQIVQGRVVAAWETPYAFTDRQTGEKVQGITRKALVVESFDREPVTVKLPSDVETAMSMMEGLAAAWQADDSVTVVCELRGLTNGRVEYKALTVVHEPELSSI